MNAQLFKSRSSFIVAALLLWAAVICLFLFYFSFVKRDRYIQSRDTLSKRTGIIIAERGALYDKNGVRLAWNESSFDLIVVSPPKNELVRSQMMIEVRAVAGGWFHYYGHLGEEAVLIPDLTITRWKILRPCVSAIR